MTIRRKSPLKPGCFSPKTPKNGVGKTVRGFFKRLSGGNVQVGCVVKTLQTSSVSPAVVSSTSYSPVDFKV